MDLGGGCDGLYTYASPIVERIMGYKPEEITGKNTSMTFFTRRRAIVQGAALAAFSAKQPFGVYQPQRA